MSKNQTLYPALWNETRSLAQRHAGFAMTLNSDSSWPRFWYWLEVLGFVFGFVTGYFCAPGILRLFLVHP